MTLDNFDLDKVMTDVLPGVLFKDSGLWMYYRDDAEFDKGDYAYQQDIYEPFSAFIKRVLIGLMEEEEKAKEEEPLVTIDYAIYVGSPV